MRSFIQSHSDNEFENLCTGILQVLATAHTVKDYTHALNSGVEFKFEVNLLGQWPLLVQAAKHHEVAPTAMISGGALFGRERV